VSDSEKALRELLETLSAAMAEKKQKKGAANSQKRRFYSRICERLQATFNPMPGGQCERASN
jgi:hypothetical protein